MGKITVSEFVSLDGVMEAPGGEPGYAHSGWVFKHVYQDWLDFKLAEVQAHEAHLLGRKTYESFAEAWPSRDGPMAEKINGMAKYVASNTLKKLEWNNAHLLQGNVAEAVAALKSKTKGDILVAGSHTLVNTLRQNNLVDEYRLLVFPVVLGSGFKLFGDMPTPLNLQLSSTQNFTNGIVMMCYTPI